MFFTLKTVREGITEDAIRINSKLELYVHKKGVNMLVDKCKGRSGQISACISFYFMYVEYVWKLAFIYTRHNFIFKNHYSDVWFIFYFSHLVLMDYIIFYRHVRSLNQSCFFSALTVGRIFYFKGLWLGFPQLGSGCTV